MNFSISRQLIKNTKYFLNIRLYHMFNRILKLSGTFYGWGRKHSGQKAVEWANFFGTSYVLLEDGFIRSIGLGVEGSPSFSIVEDELGIYYDATAPSRLEYLLNTFDFEYDLELMQTAKDAIELIKKHHISKYNHAPDIDESYFPNDGKKRILIVAQTLGDMSLKYGMAEQFSTDELVQAAYEENKDAHIYLKVHPDVLTGKKHSDIDIEKAKLTCKVMCEDVNPISLLKCVNKVYTKTSQMGFEALLLGKECVCFGMPFYAGWGVTSDKLTCKRRTAKRSVEEIFAAAYILYTRYYNAYQKRPSDILDTIHEIVHQRSMKQHNSLSHRSKKKVLAIGDSHIRVFEHSFFRYCFPRTEFKVVYVPGATASGINNVNSLSQAYNIFRSALEQERYDGIIVTLGEVDAAYTIWKRAQAHQASAENIVDDVVAKYQAFILSLHTYAPTTVLSAPLQTIADCKGCNDKTSQVRSSIDIPIQERTKLGLYFNRRIKCFCEEKSIDYLDLDPWSLGKNGTVRSWLIHPKNPCDHHYYRWRYALMIILKMLIKK